MCVWSCFLAFTIIYRLLYKLMTLLCFKMAASSARGSCRWTSSRRCRRCACVTAATRWRTVPTTSRCIASRYHRPRPAAPPVKISLRLQQLVTFHTKVVRLRRCLSARFQRLSIMIKMICRRERRSHVSWVSFENRNIPKLNSVRRQPLRLEIQSSNCLTPCRHRLHHARI